MKDSKEFPFSGTAVNGFAMLLGVLMILVAIVIFIICLPKVEALLAHIITVLIMVGFIKILCGFFVLQPNQSVVTVFFGKYRGTFRTPGFFWINPFITRQKVSLRIRNMNVAPIKVNDRIGNPIMIGMVLVWKVKDTYRAVFEVDAGDIDPLDVANDSKKAKAPQRDSVAKALDEFVAIQSEAALREVAGRYAYDGHEGKYDEITLRSESDEVNEQLERKLNELMAMAGIEVLEARLNYLAYAPEIAAVMLRSQQASAIISAREKIVDGAVGMVKMALSQLSQKQMVELDEERKATMVSNLLAVLCADEPTRPVLNTGTLYQ